MSQKHEYRKASQSANPPYHIAARESHVCRSSRVGSNVDVETRDRCRLLETEAPASMEAPALLEVAAVARARPKIEGFPIRLRRRVTTIPAVWDRDRFVAGSTLGDQGDVRLFAEALACQEKLLGKIGLMM